MAASIYAADPRTNAQCRADERRLRHIAPPSSGDLVRVDRRYLANQSSHIQLHRAAYTAYGRMKAAAEADGIPPRLLTIVSGYRSPEHQRVLWERALARYRDPATARRWVAPPGGSAHNTGRAIDFWLGTRNDSANIPALRATLPYRWLVCNAVGFGFTPYSAEPWHWEYNPPGFDTSTGVRAPVSSQPPTPPPRAPQFPPHAPVFGPPPRRRQDQSSSFADIPAGGLAGFTPSEEKALRITTTFENGRPLDFGGLTGDFDGQGLSFGLLQWNIGTGSLQPLLREFASRLPARFDALFGPDAPRLREILQPHHTVSEQLQFARSINDSRKRIIEPWRSYFNRLAADAEFRQIELQKVRGIMNVAEGYARRLGLRSERGLALMFDNVTQNGAGWLNARRTALIQQRRAAQEQQAGRPLTEREFLAVIANVVADTSAHRWQEDVRRRRMTIVNGTGVVHGEPFDLGRRFGLTDQPWDTAPSGVHGIAPPPNAMRPPASAPNPWAAPAP